MVYTYDNAERMSTVTDWLSKQTTYDYDRTGRLITTSFPTGVSEARTYNDANQLRRIVSTKSGSTLSGYTYTLDNAGNRTAVQDGSGTKSYTFDNLYRLTQVTYTDSTSQYYCYDRVGNRTATVSGCGSASYTYTNGDRMTRGNPGGTTYYYAYDNNGNQCRRYTSSISTCSISADDIYTWDYENRLTGAKWGGTNVSYTYRADSLRASKAINGGATTNYTWDVGTGLPVILQDSNYTYVYGLGLISQTDGSGNQTYMLPDGTKSNEVLTDSSGNSANTYKYDVFGGVRNTPGSSPKTDFRYAAEQFDDTLGLIYLRARYYDPATGRFLSKDPAGGKLSSPITQNKYVYAGANPVNGGDPTGLLTYVTPQGAYTGDFSEYAAAFSARRPAPTQAPPGGVNTYTRDVNGWDYQEIKGMLAKLLKSGGTGRVPVGSVAGGSRNSRSAKTLPQG